MEGALAGLLGRLGETPLWITGHSLGAALATLAAAHHRARAVYTFGSPRVGDQGFRDRLAETPVERFVNCTDVVTRVPPPVGYRHVGVHRFFDSEGRLFDEPDEMKVHEARFQGRLAYFGFGLLIPGRVKVRDLADHAIVNYVESLRRTLAVGGKAS